MVSRDTRNLRRRILLHGEEISDRQLHPVIAILSRVKVLCSLEHVSGGSVGASEQHLPNGGAPREQHESVCGERQIQSDIGLSRNLSVSLDTTYSTMSHTASPVSPKVKFVKASDFVPGEPFGTERKVLKKGWTKAKGTKPLPIDLIWEKDVPIKLRDGVVLYGDVFRGLESDQTPQPVLLPWSPYGKTGAGKLKDRKRILC